MAHVESAESTPRAAAGTPALEVCHTGVRGRSRFRSGKLYRHPERRKAFLATLQHRPGIRHVSVQDRTGSVLVLHDVDLDTDRLAGWVAAALEIEPVRRGSGESLHATRDSGLADGFLQLARVLQSFLSPAGGETASRTVPGGFGVSPHAWHALDADSVLDILEVDPEQGLSGQEVSLRLGRFGPNQLRESRARSELAILVEQFLSAPVAMLGVSALVSVFTGGLLDALVILIVVMINSGIGFFTERQAERTIRGLSDMRPRHSRVLRDGQDHLLEATGLVPGDLVLLSPGSYVPADLRLVQTRQLTLDESPLTGESMPVEKRADLVLAPDTPLGDRGNMAFMGTMVTGGTGLGAVVAHAPASELGRIRALLGEVRPPETPMEQQLGSLGTRLAILSGAVCAGVFGVGLLRGQGWLEMLKGSVSLAVAAVPEGLPAVATSTLAMGIAEMRRRRVAVRHLDAVETLGSIQVLCLDKTGTLTQNRMSVVAAQLGPDPLRFQEGRLQVPARRRRALRHMLEVMSLCSDAEVDEEDNLSGSATEVALLRLARDEGIDIRALRRGMPLLELHQRAEGRPFMSSLHRDNKSHHFIAVKGSPAELLARCDYLLDESRPLDEAMRRRIQQQNEHMAADALRVLGIACGRSEVGRELETRGLVWLGLVGMADPLRPGMRELMQAFHRAGIKTVMITGDQSATAHAVGRQLGLTDGRPIRILDSTTLDQVEPELLKGLVPNIDVFARVSPTHKLRIVQAYQQAGHVVAMTGDGVNDGPALKAADNGVAMGQSGTDVARSVADVVLEDDNLHTMLAAVEQGRTIYRNTRKTIHFLLATNFTEIEMMFLGLLFGLGQPLNPMQLLWINLLSDIFPGLALAREPATGDVMQDSPRDPRESIVPRRDLIRMGAESGVITAASLGSYLYALARYGPGAQAGTVAFNTLTTAQLLHAISCRSGSHSLFTPGNLPRNPRLELALAGSFGAQLLANLVPGLRKLLGLSPMGLTDTLVTLAGSVTPLLVNEFGKHLEIEAARRNLVEEGEEQDER